MEFYETVVTNHISIFILLFIIVPQKLNILCDCATMEIIWKVGIAFGSAVWNYPSSVVWD